MTRKLRAAVVGLRMGRFHLEAYQANPNTEVVAICDIDADFAAKTKDQYGISVMVTDYRELLDLGIDVISIASPDQQHCEQTVDCLNAGMNVLCEKPMAMSLQECRAMIDAAERNRKQLMIGQVCRYAPGFRLTKKLIDDGVIGKLFFVESEYAHDYSKAPGIGNWRIDQERKREPFLGGGCHAVDLLRWVNGDVEDVFAFANHLVLTDWPVDDCTMASFRFKNGSIGKVLVSVGCKRPYTMRSVFYGDNGTIICDNTSSTIQVYSERISDTLAFAEIPVLVNSHNVADEVDELVDAILVGKDVVPNGHEGAKTVAVCISAIESVREGKPVRVEDV